MSGSGEGFARRWSRLKRAPVVAAPAQPVAEAPLEVPPPAETIPLDEIAGWMARRVPEAWREVALRRLWVSDPAISGFVGLADYAWDFTVPGAAPGWGPLRAIDDVARLLAQAIGEAPPEPVPEPPQAIAVASLPPEPVAVGADEPAAAPAAADEPEAAPHRRRGGGATPV